MNSSTTQSTSQQSWFQRIFINHNIFYLWTGQIISQSGDSIFEIGLLWLLLDLTGSNAITGLIAMAGYLPTLLFGLYSGALVDRFDRRRLMLISDVARMGIVLLIPLLHAFGGLNGLILGLLTFAIASFNALFNPARDAIVGDLIEAKDRLKANSLIQTSWQYALFIGPAIAGILLSIVGEVQLFTLDAVTFLLSFYFIYKIAVRRKQPKVVSGSIQEAFKGSWGDVKAGLRYALKNRMIWVLLLVTAVDNLFLMGPAIIGAPIFVREILQAGAGSYAFVQVAYAIGMVTGTLLLNKYGKRWGNGRLLLWGIMLDGITFLPLLWVTSFWGMFITIVFHAMAIPMLIVARPTIIQNIVPTEMQGRIFSMMSVGVFGLTAVSIAATGALAEIIPINIIYGIIAVLAASTGVMGWFVKEFRELE